MFTLQNACIVVVVICAIVVSALTVIQYLAVLGDRRQAREIKKGQDTEKEAEKMRENARLCAIYDDDSDRKISLDLERQGDKICHKIKRVLKRSGGGKKSTLGHRYRHRVKTERPVRNN